MAFRDNSFDLCLDKGTYDALAVLLICWLNYSLVWAKQISFGQVS